MTPRNNSNSSVVSDLPEIQTLSSLKRKAEQEASCSTILSPARAPSASQSPKSLRKRTETPKSAAKTARKTNTPASKRRKANEVDQSETKDAEEDPPVMTVRAGLRNPKKRKKVIESEEEDVPVGTQDEETQNSGIGKLATDKIYPHRLTAPPAAEAPLSACSVATLTDTLPSTSMLSEPGSSAAAANSKRAVTPNPLSTLATTATAQRSSQRSFHPTRDAEGGKNSPIPAKQSSQATKSEHGGRPPPIRATLSSTKDSSDIIVDSVAIQGTPPTPRAPSPAESPESSAGRHNNDQTARSISASPAGSPERSEFSWHADDALSLSRQQRLQQQQDEEDLRKKKGKQRQSESEDELEDSEIEESMQVKSTEKKRNPSSAQSQQRDTQMQSDTEEEDEDGEEVEAPPSAQSRIQATSDAEEDQVSTNEERADKAGKGKQAPSKRRGRSSNRDSGYISPLKSSKLSKPSQSVSHDDSNSDSSIEIEDKEIEAQKKSKPARSLAPAQPRSTRSRGARVAQAETTHVRRLLVEEQQDETTEGEKEEEEAQQAEEEAQEPEIPEKRGSKRRVLKAQDTNEAEDKELSTKVETLAEQKMATRASQRNKPPVDYGPHATKDGKVLKRKDTGDSERSDKASDSNVKTVEAKHANNRGGKKAVAMAKDKANENTIDWDKCSERSSQSTSMATRSSRRPATTMRSGQKIPSLSDLFEAAKKALQHDMYNLSLSVDYEGAVSKVPRIDIECANYRGFGPRNRALGCNARITATAVDPEKSKKTVTGGIPWFIAHVQDNHCTECQDYNRDKAIDVSEAEKAAFDEAQEMLSDKATFRKFIDGRFTEEDIQKIEGNETSAEEPSPAPTAGPSKVRPAKDRSQKDPPRSRPASKPEKVIRDKEDDEEESDEEVDRNEPQKKVIDEKVDQRVSQARGQDQALFPPKSQGPAKIKYARRGGARRTIEPTPKNSIEVSDESSSDEIEMSTSGFHLQRAGASLSKKPVAGKHSVKATNQRSKENETEEQVQIPQAASPAIVEDDAPSSDVPISPPLETGSKTQAGASGPSQPPPSRRAKPNLESSKSHTAALPSRATRAAEKEVTSLKPRSRAAPGASANSNARSQTAPVAPAQGLPQKRPPSSRGMAKRTGKKAKLVKSSSDAEEEAEVKEGQGGSAQGDKEEEDDDDSGEEPSQEAPVAKKPTTLEEKGKEKEVIRPEAQPTEQAEATTSKVVEKAATAVIAAKQAESTAGINPEAEVQLSALSLPAEMLDALQTSGGLFSIQDLLRKLKIRWSKAGPGPSSDDINDDIKSILVKHRGAVLSGNFKISDEDALAVCIRENQMGGIARAAFLLEDAIYALPPQARMVGGGN